MPKLSEMEVEEIKPQVTTLGYGGKLAHIANRVASLPGRLSEWPYLVAKCGRMSRDFSSENRGARTRNRCYKCGTDEEFDAILAVYCARMEQRSTKRKLKQAVLQAEQNWTSLYKQIEDQIEKIAIEVACVDDILGVPQVLIEGDRLRYLMAFESLVKLGMTGEQATEAIDEALEMGAEPLFMSMALRMSMALK